MYGVATFVRPIRAREVKIQKRRNWGGRKGGARGGGAAT